MSHGETDGVGFRSVVDLVAVRDRHATILALLGLDHETLAFRHQGLEQRLTGVIEEARAVQRIIA